MAGFETLVRPNQTPDISPPKSSQAVTCDERADTVILQFGRGNAAEIHTISYSHSVKKYMTKQQKEMCEGDGGGGDGGGGTFDDG